MIRTLLMGPSLALLVLVASPAAGETCSSSTLASAEFAVARWCGEPPGAGTLRMLRRTGRAEEFLDVPLDTFRAVVRTPNVPRYFAEELVPRFQRRVVAEVRPNRNSPGRTRADLPQGQAAANAPVLRRKAGGENPPAGEAPLRVVRPTPGRDGR